MTKILSIYSSPRAESVSTLVARDLVEKLAKAGSGSVVEHDLASEFLPHIDDVFTQAIRKAPDEQTADEQLAVAVSDQLVAELLAADTIVLSTGLINFNIYSSLKAWIDNIARAGLTFKYGENGPVGLATGKKAYIVLSSGGVYSQGPAASLNHAGPYLTSVLNFVGISDIETIFVEGLAYGLEAVEKAIASARELNTSLASVA
jgi:FMN-dependent NADH-azoreductase